MDAPDATEVEEWLQVRHNSDCGDRAVCAPLSGDNRFYPYGIPKVFVSLRFSPDLKRSRAILAGVTARHQNSSLPNPIVYYQKSYRTGKQAKMDRQEIPCLLGV